MRLLFQLMIFLITPILCKSQTTNGEQKNIVGKWIMIKMDIKDGFYFDVSNKDSSYNRFIKIIVESYPNFSDDIEHKTFSKEDSISINSDFDKAFEEFKQLFVEFKNDNIYITNQSGAEGVSTLVTGTYSLDTKNRVLKRIENGKEIKEEKVYYELIDQSLTLRPLEIENSSSIVFKRID